MTSQRIFHTCSFQWLKKYCTFPLIKIKILIRGEIKCFKSLALFYLLMRYMNKIIFISFSFAFCMINSLMKKKHIFLCTSMSSEVLTLFFFGIFEEKNKIQMVCNDMSGKWIFHINWSNECLEVMDVIYCLS